MLVRAIEEGGLNRYRIRDALAARGLKATAAVNAAVAVRYPSLMKAIGAAGWEVMAHGLDMDHLHHGGMGLEAERALIATTLDRLEDATGTRPRGWMSPAKSQSWDTLDLLQEAGIDWCCDWDNDDMPYRMTAGAGRLVSLPVSPDSDDHAILVKNHHTEESFAEQLVDQFDYLLAEAGRAGSGRVMSIALTPWVTGQPYRIGALESALDTILSRPDVWPATGSEIVAAWSAAAPPD
jgi:peptidoglycan/xylan/chitin deacetylase (PgdA/CDA1 family)